MTAGPWIVQSVNHERVLRREQQPKLVLDARSDLVLVDQLGTSDRRRRVSSLGKSASGSPTPAIGGGLHFHRRRLQPKDSS